MPTFARFLLVGVANTVVGYGVILLLEYVVGLDRRLANAGGYLIGGTVSYLLNRRFTFESRRSHGEALPMFALAAAVCFLLNLAVLETCTALFEWSGASAQAAAVCAYTLAFFAINKYRVFRPEPGADRKGSR